VAHSKAKLTPFGRLLLVQRVEDLGWTPAQTAEALGVSRATAYKWLRRYREEGLAGLEDRSSRPSTCRQALPAHVVQEILSARQRLKFGPHRLAPEVGCPRSTIYGVLRRHRLSRLDHLDRPSAVPVRYVRDHPGELLHLDVKKLGRIPPGGGHRMLGRSTETKRRGNGYDYIHVAVDDASRVAFVGVFPDERGDTTARFLLEAAAAFVQEGVRIESILTDRAASYTRSHAFAEAKCALDIHHLVTRPYRPQTNGKAERFIRTLLEEWAYTRMYVTNQDRLDCLSDWVQFYNRRRPHTALGGQPPMAMLVNNVRGNYT
jgi:transposase InsO family protein